MAATKFFNLLALSSLALLAATFSPVSVNAVGAAGHLEARHGLRGHDAIAKRKRSSNTKRCKARPTSSSVEPSSTSSTWSSTSTSVVPTTTSTTEWSTSTAWSSSTEWSSSSSSTWSSTPSSTWSSTSSSATPSSTSSSSGSSYSGSNGAKVGMAWPNGDGDDIASYKTDKVTWLYTWSPDVSFAAQYGFKTAAMLWGYDQVDQFQSTVVAGYADAVMGVNEPNQAGQSNMTPEQAAQLWMQYIQPLKDEGYLLITPATSSDPDGLPWMQQFMGNCTGCSYDYVAVHYYDVTAQGFIDYLNLWHNTFNLPIWVTEFACENYNGGAQCSQDEVNDFYTTTINFMESTDWVDQYFPFGAMHDMQGVNGLDQLMSDSGEPTTLGYQIINGSL